MVADPGSIQEVSQVLHQLAARADVAEASVAALNNRLEAMEAVGIGTNLKLLFDKLSKLEATPTTPAKGQRKEILDSKAIVSLPNFKEAKDYKVWLIKLQHAFDQARENGRQILL